MNNMLLNSRCYFTRSDTKSASAVIESMKNKSGSVGEALVLHDPDLSAKNSIATVLPRASFSLANQLEAWKIGGSYVIRHNPLVKMKVERFYGNIDPVESEGFRTGSYSDVLIVDHRPSTLQLGSPKEKEWLIEYLDQTFQKYRDVAFPRYKRGMLHLFLSKSIVDDALLETISTTVTTHGLKNVNDEAVELLSEDYTIEDPKKKNNQED